MEETTSRTLVVIMVATLFISLFGSVATLNKFGGFRTITGAWSDNSTTTHGAVNLTINSNLIINFTDDSVNFGSGYLCTGCSTAMISTDQRNDTGCNCGWSLPTGLMLANTGNRKAAIKISNLRNSSAFFGDFSSRYGWRWETPESAGAANKNTTCLGQNQTLNDVFSATLFTNITTTEYKVGDNYTICDMFNYSDLTDTINFSFIMHVNQLAATGAKTDIWTVSATDQGQ